MDLWRLQALVSLTVEFLVCIKGLLILHSPFLKQVLVYGYTPATTPETEKVYLISS